MSTGQEKTSIISPGPAMGKVLYEARQAEYRMQGSPETGASGSSLWYALQLD